MEEVKESQHSSGSSAEVLKEVPRKRKREQIVKKKKRPRVDSDEVRMVSINQSRLHAKSFFAFRMLSNQKNRERLRNERSG